MGNQASSESEHQQHEVSVLKNEDINDTQNNHVGSELKENFKFHVDNAVQNDKDTDSHCILGNDIVNDGIVNDVTNHVIVTNNVLQRKVESVDSVYDSDEWEAISEASSKRLKSGPVPSILRMISSPTVSATRKIRLQQQQQQRNQGFENRTIQFYTKNDTSSPPPDIIYAGRDGVSGNCDTDSIGNDIDDTSFSSYEKDMPTLHVSDNDIDSLDISRSSDNYSSTYYTMNKLNHSSILFPIDENKIVDDVSNHKVTSSPGLIRFTIYFMIRIAFCCIFIFFSAHTLKRAGVVEDDLPTTIKNALDDMATTASRNGLPYMLSQDVRPGYQLAQNGATAHFPLVIIPGFVSSGIEVWGGKECAKPYFRQRFWTALTSATTFFTDTNCWNEHMKLDPYTGNDPHPDIRLRASEGFAATDYFFGNYWVWSKLIENLADVGYTNNNMSMEPYDWRLPFHMLEERDGYFTKLKARIEVMKHTNNNRKVVVAAHSMGALVLHYFFAWVSQNDKNWVDTYVHTYIDIAGCLLGVPKAATALLSGEMKDTAVILGPMGKVLEQFFGRKLRRDLWSTWGSLWSMLPKGGNAIWGQGYDICSTSNGNSSDKMDMFCTDNENLYTPMVALTYGGATEDAIIGIYDAIQSGINLNITLQTLLQHDNYTVEEIIHFLQSYGSGLGPDTIGAQLSFNEDDRKTNGRYINKNMNNNGKKYNRNSDIWHDPSRTPLPYAPNMKIVCMYGTGLPTERAFQYKINWKTSADNSESVDEIISDPPLLLDSTYNDDIHNISNGIRYTDGDGSVPLVSLGYLCIDGWRRHDSSGLNPGRIQITTREYGHERIFVVDDPMRSGPKSSDHVDILGNVDMTTDFLKIVTNYNISDVILNDRIISNIRTVSENINKHGGIYKNKYQHRNGNKKKNIRRHVHNGINNIQRLLLNNFVKKRQETNLHNEL